jgi:hypothetical protein
VLSWPRQAVLTVFQILTADDWPLLMQGSHIACNCGHAHVGSDKGGDGEIGGDCDGVCAIASHACVCVRAHA